MKAIQLAAIALATALSVNHAAAQVDDVLNITFQDGRTARCNISDIEEITFDDVAITPAEPTEIGGHEYVDLGLPSGLMWATCNVGADFPTEYGYCFAWGETNTKSVYNIFTGRYCKLSFQDLVQSEVIDEAGDLTANYDAATYLWGEDWRTPTREEFLELMEHCTFLWTVTENETTGVRVTGPNGNYIFIPAAGNYHGFQGEHGRYWTATADTEYDRSWSFFFDENSRFVTLDLRGTGIPVRPVTELAQ